MKQSIWWLCSAVISVVLMLVLIYLWIQMNEHEIKGENVSVLEQGEIIQGDYIKESYQLTNESVVDEFLEKHWDSKNDHGVAGELPTIKIKTGIFVQSLKFINSTEVNLTGYIWQRYKKGIHDEVNPCADIRINDECTEVGFILPEQVDSGSDLEPRVLYRIEEGDEEVIGWYFEATLRQSFDYKKYPFDHKNVRVRIWAKDFSKNVVLVPDFEAYGYKTNEYDIFGIEEDIVLGAWVRQNTYFDYKLSSYDTNFGINNFVGKNGFPELSYNFVLKRKFSNAFIVYLLPLLLVAALLFAALLTVNDKEELSGRKGFSTLRFIGAASVLFFVVASGHLQLREQFVGAGIVYIEYFYILMYAMIVAVTANVFIFSVKSKRRIKLIQYNDNLIPKVAYWPIVLASLILITVLVMMESK